MKADIHSIYLEVKKGNLIAAHEGEITSEVITEFLSKVEDSLLQNGEAVKIVRKLYNILVEALQNLYHHLEIPPNFFKSSELSSGRIISHHHIDQQESIIKELIAARDNISAYSLATNS